ncbi:MAG: LysR family transcriptional regulator substrate-binding protein [Hyphomicrobiaceae bacterium]
MAADLTRSLQEELPAVRLPRALAESVEIMQGLAEFAIDAGLTYLDNEPVTGLLAEPLYTERYCLFVRADHAVAGRQHVTWGEAAALPLCLLTPNMQNRRIIDKAFQHGRHDPVPRLETNSVVNLYANVRRMGLASVMPEYFLHALGPLPDIRAIPLVEPEVEHSVGLVTLPREPAPRLIEALTAAARTLRMKLKRPTLRST